MAIVGGSKVSTKLDLLGNLLSKVDVLVIVGAMANTFLAAKGMPVGRSLQEKDLHETARADHGPGGGGLLRDRAAGGRHHRAGVQGACADADSAGGRRA